MSIDHESSGMQENHRYKPNIIMCYRDNEIHRKLEEVLKIRLSGSMRSYVADRNATQEQTKKYFADNMNSQDIIDILANEDPLLILADNNFSNMCLPKTLLNYPDKEIIFDRIEDVMGRVWRSLKHGDISKSTENIVKIYKDEGIKKAIIILGIHDSGLIERYYDITNHGFAGDEKYESFPSEKRFEIIYDLFRNPFKEQNIDTYACVLNDRKYVLAIGKSISDFDINGPYYRDVKNHQDVSLDDAIIIADRHVGRGRLLGAFQKSPVILFKHEWGIFEQIKGPSHTPKYITSASIDEMIGSVAEYLTNEDKWDIGEK